MIQVVNRVAEDLQAGALEELDAAEDVSQPDEVEEETDDVKLAVKAAADIPADFVEWETVSPNKQCQA